MAVDIGIVVGDAGLPTTADLEVFNRVEDLGYVPTYVDDAAAVPAGRDGFVICDSVTAATVGTKYRDLTVPVITLEFDLWDDNRLAANTGAATAASAAFDLEAHVITAGFADPLTVLTSALAQRGVLDADLPAGRSIFARPGADATRAMGWTFETGAALTVGTAPARRVALHLPEAWTTALTSSGVDLLERMFEWAFRPFAVTFDAGLSRVRVSADGLGNAVGATVQRSLDLITWTTVRGGDPAPVSGGVLQLDDYEFSPNVVNHYRVTVARDVRSPGIGFAGAAAAANNAAINPALPTAARAKHLLLYYSAVRDGSGTITLSGPAGYSVLHAADGHLKVYGKQHGGSESVPTITPSGAAAGSDVQGQSVALRNATVAVSTKDHVLTLTPEMNVSFPALQVTRPRQVMLFLGWKQTGWTSVAALSGGTPFLNYSEIGDPASTVGNDSAMVWGWNQQFDVEPEDIPAGAFVVTGGVAHVTRGAVLALEPMTLTLSSSVTPTQDTVWIKDLVRPFLNTQVTVVEYSDLVVPDRTGIFEVIGRSYAVAVTDVRTTRRQTVTVMLPTPEAAADFVGRLSPGAPILFQTPPGCPIPGMYAVVGPLRVARMSKRATRRYVELPLTEVAPPSNDLVGATLTWQTVISSYATWADLIAAEATWSDVLEGIGSPADVIVP